MKWRIRVLRKAQNRSWCLAVILGAFSLPPSYGLCQDNVAEAKAEFERGVSLYQSGRYEEAAKSFRYANEIKPAWSLLFNIGQSEAAAKRYGLAYEAFEEYLAKGGDDLAESRKVLVMNEQDKLLKLIGSLEVSSPAGATVIVDGMERGTAPLPGRIKIAAGMVHTVEVWLEGAVLLSEEVKVSQGEIIRVEAVGEREASANEGGVRSESAQASTADKRVNENEPDPMIRSARVIAGVGIGLGSASIIAAIPTGAVALSVKGDLAKACQGDICPTDQKKNKEKKDALAMSSDIMMILGVVATGIGTGMLIWLRKARKRSNMEQTISIAPIFGKSTAALGVSGRF